jgi:undecaprenyl diphosphate synthase
MNPSQTVPQHVAIVMDGNGRWAQGRLLPRVAGHRQGVEALRSCVRHGAQRGVKVLTVFAFSSENWNRPGEEVSYLMGLLVHAVKREIAEFRRAGVRVRFIGDRDGLSGEVLDSIDYAELETAGGQGMQLNVCFNYGGRWDIVQAAASVRAQNLELTEQSLARALALSHAPDPDLVIRTGGEKRISNFLLWQSAYAEFVFSDRLWPDFDAAALDEALDEYARRERRFGMTSRQVQASASVAS